MRIVHVGMTISGGAGRGMVGLHEGLLDLGFDSVVLTLHSTARYTPQLVQLGRGRELTARAAMRGDRALRHLLGGSALDDYHTSVVPGPMLHSLEQLRPDIVHLHWIGDLLTPGQIAAIARKRPTVWTMRDLAPITGGCHYAHGCSLFESHCRSCPLLQRGWRLDPSFWLHELKLHRFRDAGLRPVALSRWLAVQVSRARLFDDRIPDVVPPGINASTFKPCDRVTARESFGLESQTPVIGFVALSPLGDPRKGGRLLDAALADLAGPMPSIRALITTTPAALAEASLRFEAWMPVGRLDSDARLVELYSACDVVVVPSTEEAFGKVAAEAASSGTPVVAFHGTGVADALAHPGVGFLAEHGSITGLRTGIQWGLQQPSDHWSRVVRHRAIKKEFGLMTQAKRYRDIYKSSMSGQGASTTP